MSLRMSPSGNPWWMHLVPRKRPSLLVGQLIAFGLAALSAGIWIGLRDYLPGAPFNTFFPFIIVAVAWGGRAAGFALIAWAVVFAAVIWLFVRPTNLPAAVIATLVLLLLGAITIAIVHALQSLVSALQQAEGQAEVMAREMRHRVGNLMQLVLAIARMTARSSSELVDFMPRFEGRLKALSEAHHLSSGGRQMPGDLETLLRVLLSAYDPERLLLQGPKLSLDGDTALRLALVVHELGTNAAKYGALAISTGVVKIEWHNAAGKLDLTWREEGGPRVSPPTHSGFGSRLITATLAAAGGAANITFAPAGIECRLHLPLQS